MKLGIVVDLGLLREILGTLRIDGKQWWVVNDSEDIAKRGSLTIAHGYPGCCDRLNTLFFQTPGLNPREANVRLERFVVLLEHSHWLPEEPGFHVERGRIVQDSAEDLLCALAPIQRVLIDRLQQALQEFGMDR